MKYIFLLLAILYSATVNAQSFERTYQTAPLNYNESAEVSIAIGENTIFAIKEDSSVNWNVKLVKLNKHGDIIKTSRIDKHNILAFLKTDDSHLLLIMDDGFSSNLSIAKIDIDLNIHWIKPTGYNITSFVKTKKINDNSYILMGRFEKNQKYKLLYLDSIGTIQNYNSVFNTFDDNNMSRDLVESNDTVFVFFQTHIYLNTNELIIASKRKQDNTILNSLTISHNSITYGNLIEIKNENIIIYGQNLGKNDLLKFKYTLDKNLNIIKIDSLTLADGASEYNEIFTKHNNTIYLLDKFENRMTTVDELFKIKRIDHFTDETLYIKNFSLNDNAAIITASQYLATPKISLSYVHRFDPTIPLGLGNTSNMNFTIYPIPFEQELKLDFNKVQQYVNVKLYNTLGQLKHYSSFEYTQHISLESLDLEKGIYLIEIETPEGKSSKRVIKL